MYTPAEGYRRHRAEATLQRSVMASTITRTLCVAAMVLLVLLTGTASGAEQQNRPGIPNALGIYTGCYSASTGDLRLIAGSQGCRSAERRVTWNRRGQRGPLGREGEPGAPGPSGPQGAMGSQGSSGSQGPAGAAGPQGLAGATRPRRTSGPAGLGRRDGASRCNRCSRPSRRRRCHRSAGLGRASGRTRLGRRDRLRGACRPDRRDRSQPARPVQRGRRGRRDLSWSRERLSPRLPTLLETRS